MMNNPLIFVHLDPYMGISLPTYSTWLHEISTLVLVQVVAVLRCRNFRWNVVLLLLVLLVLVLCTIVQLLLSSAH